MSREISLGAARALLPPRKPDDHKGTYGHLFVVSGARGFTGATRMTCEAAYRSGVGLVSAGIPRPLADVLSAALLETMTLPLPATDAETFAYSALEPALSFAQEKDAVAIGPGVSQHDETRRFVLDFIRRCPLPMVIDADGLNCLSSDVAALDESDSPRIVTPHPGEMARLVGAGTMEVQQDREKVAARFAKGHRCVVVLKGYRTVVADAEGHVAVNPTGNSGMGTGGTGDVLTGILGGLLAQGMAPFDAAVLSVYAHGLAGDIAAELKTMRGMIAGDVIDALPEAWKKLESKD